MRLQGGCIGHGKTGSIDPQGPMAQPTPLLEGCVLQGVTHRAKTLLAHYERALQASLPRDRGRDGLPAPDVAEAYRRYCHEESARKSAAP
jgi:hypothetical protein